MSGVTGNLKIASRKDFKEILKSYTKILSKFPGFVSVDTSGSYNSNKFKTSFGDIDLIVYIKGYDQDIKKIKVHLAKYLTALSSKIIVPFESEKYKGRRYYNSGEIITISYKLPRSDIQACQIDNIIAVSEVEAKFKKDFLDMPAEKQGMVLGLVKTVLTEHEPAGVFKRLKIKAELDIGEDQEYEFNLSSKEIQLRLVTYVEVGSFKQKSREIVWTSRDWDLLQKILIDFDLGSSFEDLIKQAKKKLKYPRSSRRMAGVFKSMISIKSGEVGKEKGIAKQRALDKVQKIFGESFRDVITEMASGKNVVYTFGRFSPPTLGHQALWDFVAKQAKKIRGEAIIYPSFSQDNERNPLQPKDKIKFMKKVIKGAKVSEDPKLNDPYKILEDLVNKGYTKIHFVVGADRKDVFNPLKKYAYDWSEGKTTIDIITFNENRLGDYSGTKMRELALADNFDEFYADLPKGFSTKEGQKIFDLTKEGLDIK